MTKVKLWASRMAPWRDDPLQADVVRVWNSRTERRLISKLCAEAKEPKI